MAQNLIIDGVVLNGVDSISMTNENGKKVTYVEKTNTGTGVYVAQIGERNFYTVEDALKTAVSGETIMLIADCVENANLLVPGGVTLDLNGYTLEAPVFATATGSQVLNSQLSGFLKVPQSGIAFNTGNTYLPVWNGVDGYYLIRFGWTINFNVDKETGVATYKFLPKPRNGSTNNLEVVEMWQNGAADNQIRIEGRVEWDTEYGKQTLNLIYSDDTISTIYTENPSLTGSKCFVFTTNSTEGFTNVVMYATFVSELGPTYSSVKKAVN